jgi:hypothetical protein
MGHEREAQATCLARQAGKAVEATLATAGERRSKAAHDSRSHVELDRLRQSTRCADFSLSRDAGRRVTPQKRSWE